MLLLLLILFPLEFLRHKIEEIINVSEKSTMAEAQNLLNNELKEYFSNLLFYCQYDCGKNVTFGCITTICPSQISCRKS